MTKKLKKFTQPTKDEIAKYAFHLWEAEGRQHGRDMDYWLEAEAHLIADRRYEAGMLRPEDKRPGMASAASAGA